MLPSTHPAALPGTPDDGVVAEWLGMKVILDVNVPTTSGSGEQDYVILGHSPDWLLYEGPLNFEVNKETLSRAMSVLLVAWRYAALIVRYRSSVCLVGRLIRRWGRGRNAMTEGEIFVDEILDGPGDFHYPFSNLRLREVPPDLRITSELYEGIATTSENPTLSAHQKVGEWVGACLWGIEQLERELVAMREAGSG